jgi:Domain of unknown function (DUF5666)
MKRNALICFLLALLLAIAAASLSAQATGGAVKQLGSIRSITGSALSLTTDQGTELAVRIQSGARLLRLAPGETDLTRATSIQPSDLQAGDRVLVRGKLASDGVAVEATAVFVMKQGDIAQQKQQELLDWQKRGLAGLVKQVEGREGNITISVSGAGGSKTVVVSTTPKTVVRRYSPDSVKWAEASPATIEDIHPGDQLRAKGDKNAAGTQIVAEEIVAGTFRNIAGLITAIDPTQGIVTVQDLASKKPVTVKITTDSQMRKLPAQMAQGLAMRLKATTPPTPSSASAPRAAPAEGARARGADLDQLLVRLPASALGDLHKGDAVMMVSTQGSASKPPVAITLLGGVEAILTASPVGNGVQSFLTPWSLASAPGGDQQ